MLLIWSIVHRPSSIVLQRLRTNDRVNACLHRLQEIRLEGGKKLKIDLWCWRRTERVFSSCGVWSFSPWHSTNKFSGIFLLFLPSFLSNTSNPFIFTLFLHLSFAISLCFVETPFLFLCKVVFTFVFSPTRSTK